MPQNDQHQTNKSTVTASTQTATTAANNKANKANAKQKGTGMEACMRGLAIIGIFLHNYCHWLGPMVKENEYTFNAENVAGMNRALLHADAHLPLHLLSFFGHYGVPVFLFLSGFGLFKKYHETYAPVGKFLFGHYLKLFRMMAVGFALFIFIDAQTPPSWHYDSLKIIAQLLMFNNLLPRPDKMIWPGPFWFFGLMMQFYLLYRLMLHRRHWGVTVLVMVLCVLVQLQLSPISLQLHGRHASLWFRTALCSLSKQVYALGRRSHQAVGRPFNMFGFGLLPQSEFRGVDLCSPCCMPFGVLNCQIAGSHHIFGMALSSPLLDG